MATFVILVTSVSPATVVTFVHLLTFVHLFTFVRRGRWLVEFGGVLHSQARHGSALPNFTRTNIYDKYSGWMKISTHLDHVSHRKTAYGTNWSNGWTYRVHIKNTRRDWISPRDEFRTTSSAERLAPLRAEREQIQLFWNTFKVFEHLQSFWNNFEVVKVSHLKARSEILT